MKKILIVSALVLAPSCAALGLGGGEGSGDPTVDAIAASAGTGATVLTGNPAIGAAVGSLVTAVGAWFVVKRKKTAEAKA